MFYLTTKYRIIGTIRGRVFIPYLHLNLQYYSDYANNFCRIAPLVIIFITSFSHKNMVKSQDSSGTDESSHWFETWFNHPLYLEVYRHRDQEEAARCIRTILSVSGLEIKDPASISVLDIACGAGRHAIELARLGFCVTGNDLSPFLLEEARKEAITCSLQLELSCCDMRHIPGSGLFDLVVQLFTSFGYFDLKEDDRVVLGKVYRALCLILSILFILPEILPLKLDESPATLRCWNNAHFMRTGLPKPLPLPLLSAKNSPSVSLYGYTARRRL